MTARRGTEAGTYMRLSSDPGAASAVTCSRRRALRRQGKQVAGVCVPVTKAAAISLQPHLGPRVTSKF